MPAPPSPPPLIEAETALDAAAIDGVVARAFGPGRFAKTAERLREGKVPLVGLVARDGDAVIGSVRLWRVRIGAAEAAFLGPIAVEAGARREGVGAALVDRALAESRALGLAGVLLVGDTPYFGRFGFEVAAGVRLPGPVDPRRVLWLGFAGAPPAGAVSAV